MLPLRTLHARFTGVACDAESLLHEDPGIKIRVTGVPRVLEGKTYTFLDFQEVYYSGDLL